MAIPVEMPKMSDTMEEGLLVTWLVEEGADVSSGDILAQVETDKATMDLEVYDDGVLLKQVASEGDSVPIGGLIAVLGKAGEDISALLGKYNAGGNGSVAPTTQVEASEEEAVQKEVVNPLEEGVRLKASPLARKIARDSGISLSKVTGSGPEGRIIKRDVEAAADGGQIKIATPAPIAVPKTAPVTAPSKPVSRPAATVVEAGTYRSVKLTPMRKTIARRLSESKFTSPHFYLQMDVDMEEAIAVRERINHATEAMGLAKVSFNDIVNKVCAVALRQHPGVNASWLEAEGEIRYHHDVHIAVAVAIDEGLVTPVLRHTDKKGLAEIAAETKDLAKRARERTLEPADWEGSTFTTSNLGMFGIERFTAIINPPNSCILAIGAIRDVPVVKDGAVVPGKRMTLSLSCDHRVVDGVVGSKFLNTVVSLLENPAALLV